MWSDRKKQIHKQIEIQHESTKKVDINFYFRKQLFVENCVFSRKDLSTLHRLLSLHDLKIEGENKQQKVIQVALQNLFNKESIKPSLINEKIVYIYSIPTYNCFYIILFFYFMLFSVSAITSTCICTSQLLSISFVF